MNNGRKNEPLGDNFDDTVPPTDEELRSQSKSIEQMRAEAERAQTHYVLQKCRTSAQADLEGNLFRTVPADSTSPSAESGDGPMPPNFFFWQGERFRLEPIPWWVLNTLWGRPSVPVEEVVSVAWGSGADVADGSVRSALSRVNGILGEAKFAERLSLQSAHVSWS
jgi:hypothetical protein